MTIESCSMFRYDVEDHVMVLSTYVMVLSTYVVFSSHEEELQMQRAAIAQLKCCIPSCVLLRKFECHDCIYCCNYAAG